MVKHERLADSIDVDHRAGSAASRLTQKTSLSSDCGQRGSYLHRNKLPPSATVHERYCVATRRLTAETFERIDRGVPSTQ
jgi:hypothetical protein